MGIGELGRRLAGRTAARRDAGDAWAEAFARLSRSALTWEVAGREDSPGGAYTWQYSVRRRASGAGPAYGATKLARRLDLAELLDVERAARRAIRERRWVILAGSADLPLERQEAIARRVRFIRPGGGSG